MSIAVMNNVWRYSKASGTDLLVLLALADNANDEGECWPSIRYVALKCRIDTRTTQRRIRSLERIGEVVVVRGAGRAGSTGGTKSNRYRIVVHIPDEEGGGDLPGGGTGAREGVARVPPEPSVRTVNDSSLVAAAPKPARQRSLQIPEDFAVTHDMRQWCAAQGIRSDPMAETEKFIDFHRSKGNTFADPVRAWRNWMRNADQFARPASSKGPGRSTAAIDRVFGQLVADARAIEATTGGS